MKLKNITIHRSGQNYGPYREKRVIDFLDQGLVIETDLAWYPGITGWVSLREALSLDTLTTGEQNVDSDKHALLDELQDAQAFELFAKIKKLLNKGETEFAYDLLVGSQQILGTATYLFENVELDGESLLLPEWVDWEFESSSKLFFYLILAIGDLGTLPNIRKILDELSLIDLSHCKLKEVPEALFSLENVQRINLSGNALNELPDKIKEMTGLKTLQLSENHFKNIPRILKDIQTLERIELNENNLSEDENAWNTLMAISGLCSINLSNTQIKLSGDIRTDSCLWEEIDLSQNDFNHAPLADFLRSLSKIKSLRVLNLSSCQLSQVHQELSLLENLVSLNLSQNSLGKIPRELNNLSNLESVELWGNPCIPEPSSQIHEDFPPIGDSEHIDLEETLEDWYEPGPIIDDEESLKKLSSFAEIIQSEDLDEINGFIESIVHDHDPALLIELVRGCSLSPEGYLLPGLYFPFPFWLDSVFTTNEVGDDPSGRWKGTPWSCSDDDGRDGAAYSNYALLSLITSLPNDSRIHPSLLKSNVRRLNLVLPGEIPTGINQFSELEELSIARSALSSLPSEIGCFNKLISLSLEDNQICEIPESFAGLTTLKNLILRNNQITKVGSWVGSMINLRILDLAKNQVPELPSELGHLKNLKFLGLRSNQLTSLPQEIGNLQNLQHLWLGDNCIEYLPVQLYQIKTLLAMGLVDNSCIPTNSKWVRGIDLSHRIDKIHKMAISAENDDDAEWVLKNLRAWGGS